MTPISEEEVLLLHRYVCEGIADPSASMLLYYVAGAGSRNVSELTEPSTWPSPPSPTTCASCASAASSTLYAMAPPSSTPSATPASSRPSKSCVPMSLIS